MGSSRALIENLNLEFAERDATEIPLFEEESPVLATDTLGGLDFDPELAGYDPFF